MEITPRREPLQLQGALGFGLIVPFFRSLGLAFRRVDGLPSFRYPVTEPLRTRVLLTCSSKSPMCDSSCSSCTNNRSLVHDGQDVRLSPSHATRRFGISGSLFGRLCDLHGRDHGRPTIGGKRILGVQRNSLGWIDRKSLWRDPQCCA